MRASEDSPWVDSRQQEPHKVDRLADGQGKQGRVRGKDRERETDQAGTDPTTHHSCGVIKKSYSFCANNTFAIS